LTIKLTRGTGDLRPPASSFWLLAFGLNLPHAEQSYGPHPALRTHSALSHQLSALSVLITES